MRRAGSAHPRCTHSSATTLDLVPDPKSWLGITAQSSFAAILDDGRPIQERLWSAYYYKLSSLQREWFPQADAQSRRPWSGDACDIHETCPVARV